MTRIRRPCSVTGSAGILNWASGADATFRAANVWTTEDYPTMLPTPQGKIVGETIQNYRTFTVPKHNTHRNRVCRQ